MRAAMGKTIAFGGWAVPPEILSGFLASVDCADGADGTNSVDNARNVEYVDVNRAMPGLFDGGGGLRGDWAEIVVERCRLTSENPPDVIAGWSTGAMFAYAVAAIVRPQRVILLSATPCFCRRGDFRFGAAPSVVDKMLAAVESDRGATLRSFYERCGLRPRPDAACGYTASELVHGLMFLKQADIRGLCAPRAIRPVFYHGVDDVIIPIAAARHFRELTGGTLVEADGGHAFFNPHALS